MPGFTYQATSVKNLNEAAALGGLACLYCCADAFFFFFFCWFPNTSAQFWKSLLLDDSQSGLGASWSCDGARINYRPSARDFFFFDRDGRKCAKISQLSGRDGWNMHASAEASPLDTGKTELLCAITPAIVFAALQQPPCWSLSSCIKCLQALHSTSTPASEALLLTCFERGDPLNPKFT